jgi:hypothetical protein
MWVSRRARRAAAALVAAAAAGVVAAPARDARADCDPRPEASTCLTSDALWPMPGPQRFAYVASTELTQPGNFGLALVSTYQKRPIDLHVATPGPMGTDAAAIDDQIDTTLVTSFGVVDRVAAYVAIPGTLHQTGGGSSAATGRPAPASSSLRDPRVGVALGALPRAPEGMFAAAVYTDLQVPTRSTTDFAGEKGFVVAPTVTADARFAGRFVVAADLGGRFRAVTQSFYGERQTTQLLFGLGGGVDILPRELLSVGVEARTILGLGARADLGQDRFGPTSSNAHSVLGGEWLASLRSAFFSSRVSVLAGGGGTLPLDGLLGIGRVRLVLGLAYTPGAPPPPPARVEEPRERAPREEPAPAAAARPVAAPPPPRAAVVVAPPPRPGTCAATCKADSFSAFPASEESGLATSVTPYLTELSRCLVRFGAEGIRPAILLRFTEAGVESESRLDLGGYEDMACVKDARAHAPVFSVSRGTTVRCELRCQ